MAFRRGRISAISRHCMLRPRRHCKQVTLFVSTHPSPLHLLRFILLLLSPFTSLSPFALPLSPFNSFTCFTAFSASSASPSCSSTLTAHPAPPALLAAPFALGERNAPSGVGGMCDGDGCKKQGVGRITGGGSFYSLPCMWTLWFSETTSYAFVLLHSPFCA